MQHIVDELSKRRVFRAVAWYVAFVLAGWQAADYVIAALALPEWLMRYLVISAIAGLPVVVTVSWLVDLGGNSPNSIILTKHRRRQVVFVAAGCVCLIAVAAIVRLIPQRSASAEHQPLANVSLELGIESYFSGDLDRAAAILRTVGTDSTQVVAKRQEALRYLARALSERGDATSAAAALEKLLETEPPLALMLPGVETDTIIALYYQARRAKIAREATVLQPSATTAIEVLRFMASGSPPADLANDWSALASAVPELLLNDLFHRLKGVTFVDRYDLGRHRYDTYRYLDSPSAARNARPSHLIIGSVAGAREQVLLSAWVIDATNGTLAHSAQVLVPNVQLLTEGVSQLSSELAGRIERAQMTRR